MLITTELPEIKNPLIIGSGDGLWFPAGDALGFNLKNVRRTHVKPIWFVPTFRLRQA